jgi:hypothetical protein
MRHISSADAFRELNDWNKDSFVGCVFAKEDAKVAFRLRRLKLELRRPSLFLVGESATAWLHFSDDVVFVLGNVNDMAAAAYGAGLDIPSDTGIRARFGNGDLCFIFPERLFP